MVSSPGFVSNARNFSALFRLGFPAPTTDLCLKLAANINSLAHSPKGTPSSALAHTLRPVVSTQFQILFHSPRRGSFHLSLTVLLRYRSVRVFSLGGWSPLLPTMLASIVVLRIIASMLRFRLRDSHPLWRNFPNASASLRIPSRESCNPVRLNERFGLFRFRSPLLAESSPLLVLLRCFSSDGSPPVYPG